MYYQYLIRIGLVTLILYGLNFANDDFTYGQRLTNYGPHRHSRSTHDTSLVYLTKVWC